jgi:class 3 adenylate cyclase
METKFTTIVCSDVIGYSKMMRADERGTLIKLDRCRTLIDKLISLHHGRLFNTAGDSVLVEFSHPLDAILFSMKMQETMLELNNGMRWRIGMHAGNVFIYGTNLLGDTVNLAARIESMSDYGGICMSDSLYNIVKDQDATIQFQSRGSQSFKNIEQPMEIWAVTVPGSERNPNAKPKENVRYSTEELIRSVINDIPAQNKTLSDAQNYKRDRKFAAALRILMWRVTKKCGMSLDELLDMASKNLVPKELQDCVVAIISTYCKNVDSERAMKIAALLEGTLGSHRAMSMRFWEVAAKTNVEAELKYATIILDDDHSSKNEIESAVEHLTHAAKKKSIPAIMRLVDYYKNLDDKKEQFKWLWVARALRDSTAQDLLQNLANTITKNDFMNYKIDGDALIDDINFHSTDRYL